MNSIYDIAESYLGLKEFPGAQHNKAIVNMFAATGNSWVKDDETPWCAAFVGAVLAQAGLQGTGKLNARSYATWGQAVASLEEAQPGDIIVFWRGSPASSQGHVAFFSSYTGKTLKVLGGNQGDAVSVASYPASRVMAIRRAIEPKTSLTQSTTVQASAVQIASAAGAGISAVSALSGTAQVVAIAACAVVILAGLWIMRERIKKWSGGVR